MIKTSMNNKKRKNKSPLSAAILLTMLSALAVTSCSKSTDDSVPETNTEEVNTTDAVNPDVVVVTDSSDADATEQKLLESYANMAQAAYEDSLQGAQKLQDAVNQLVDAPTKENMATAKAAYKAARQPYSQTEVFRFDEGFVTANPDRAIESVDGWEGQVNAWPLDEALIDYVSTDYSGEYNSQDNIINSDSLSVAGVQKDTSTITPEVLADMNEIGGSEANVTTGYHAIEFLLWGQDTNGVGEGAGNRPVSDYMADENCTSGVGNSSPAAVCAKRGEYLKAATQLLVNDLTNMVAQWQPNSTNTLRNDLMSRAGNNAIRQVFYQMGSLSLGELASERMQVAFVTGSTEDEHECFSDLTHLSYANNARGIDNVFNGQYKTVSGSMVGGYGIKQYLMDNGQTDAANQLDAEFKKVGSSFDAIVDAGENQGIKVDQMIATGSQAQTQGVSAEEQAKRRGWVESAITNLQELTGAIENAASSVGIDSLDSDAGSQF